MNEYSRIANFFAATKQGLFENIKTKHQNLADYPQENTPKDHFYFFLRIIETMKISQRNVPLCVQMLFDLFQITPEYSEETAEKMTPEVVSSFIQLISSYPPDRNIVGNQINKCILAFALFLLPQKVEIASKLAKTILSQCGNTNKKGVFTLFINIAQLYDANLSDENYKKLFLDCKRQVEYMSCSVKEIEGMPHHILTANLAGNLINSLNLRKPETVKFATTEVSKILCANPFVLYYVNLKNSETFDIVDLPPLSVLATANVSISPFIFNAYRTVFLETITALIASIPGTGSNYENSFHDVYTTFSHLSRGYAYYDALAIVLRHFMRSSYLKPYYLNINAIILNKLPREKTGGNIDGLRQLYTCFIVCGLYGHVTPAGLEFLCENRETLLVLVQQICDLTPESPLRQRALNLRNALAKNFIPEQSLVERSYALILAIDTPSISDRYTPVVLDQFTRALDNAAAIEPFFEFLYVYLKKTGKERFDGYQILDILSAVEHVSHCCQEWNYRATWRALIRSKAIERVQPTNVFLILRNPISINPVRFVGFLSYLSEILKTADFIPFLKAHPSIIIDTIDMSTNSELPVCTYLLVEILDKVAQHIELIGQIIPCFKFLKNEYPLRKTLRIIGALISSPRLIKATSGINVVWTRVAQIISSNADICSLKVIIFAAKVYAEGNTKDAQNIVNQILLNITKENAHFAYSAIASIVLLAPGVTLSPAFVNSPVEIGEKKEIIQFVNLIANRNDEFKRLRSLFTIDWYNISSEDSWVRQVTCSAYVSSNSSTK